MSNDRPSFSTMRLDGAVKWLLISNVLVYIAQQIAPGWMEWHFGLVPAQILSNGWAWQALTYMFLHGGLFHLLINLFSLWMFGRELEHLWGTAEFLKFYFVCGVGAALFNVALDFRSTIPVIGASGATYGLLVAFAMLFPDSLIYLYGLLPVKAKHFVLVLGVIEFLSGLSGASTAIARFAHLGGLLTGFLYLKSYEMRSFIGRGLRNVRDSFTVRQRPRVKFEVLREEDVAAQVDRILDKVLVQGEGSLTDKEREIMRRYSTKKH